MLGAMHTPRLTVIRTFTPPMHKYTQHTSFFFSFLASTEKCSKIYNSIFPLYIVMHCSLLLTFFK
uniref:Uncharacterized protein n=1 Tax=Anguilla anguilla TaxID=7936 RepID=A0A0E9VLN6_ANGAN